MFAPLYTRRRSDVSFFGTIRLTDDSGDTFIVDLYTGPNSDYIVFGNDADDWVSSTHVPDDKRALVRRAMNIISLM